VTSAINAARANTVMGTAVSITSADVTFPFDAATGNSTRFSEVPDDGRGNRC
jgi:hypothetical protein